MLHKLNFFYFNFNNDLFKQDDFKDIVKMYLWSWENIFNLFQLYSYFLHILAMEGT